MIRTETELASMRKAGRVTAEMLAACREAVRPGVSTADLDRVAREVLERRGARSNFLGYHGFPAVICASRNNVIVHGIPNEEEILHEGDIISIDAGAIVEGYHGDAAITVAVGSVPKRVERLIEVTEQSLVAGIREMVAGNHLHDIGRAVEQIAVAAHLGVIRDYVGHGIGTQMHEPPNVPNYWPGRAGPKLRVHEVYAVEPMFTLGGEDTVVLPDGWGVVTADGTWAAHFEHTIAITDSGPEVFTVLDDIS
ncbi:type I methionyl aminopeptidase [Ferrimicrobium acidiphilum]|uniref:type I methionyl aminopeptidase n=1 Tax=Ferrimicrobium acidiphilum TaxID=121039 RepID=UPI0023F38E76|nr:type I methionyl aminopeptidase [Ferrimicrobium acidiphilum]